MMPIRRLAVLTVHRSAGTLKPIHLTRSFHSSCVLAALTPSLEPDSQGRGISPLMRYSEQHSTPLPDKFVRLHENTIEEYQTRADMTISALQGQLLQLLMRMTRPKLVLELGCFMGYSAMAMADGMPKGTTLYTCEKDAKAAGLARDLFVHHGYQPSSAESVRQPVAIELLEGAALDSLQGLADKKLQFDAVFLGKNPPATWFCLSLLPSASSDPIRAINLPVPSGNKPLGIGWNVDADKGNYINYFNFILDNNLLTPHGYILADNVLFRGLVLQARESPSSLPSPPASPQLAPQSGNNPERKEKRRPMTLEQKTGNHMIAFNEHVKNDQRVEVVVLPLFDGISFIMRKKVPT